MNRQYRICKDKHVGAAGYALESLCQLADGRAYPPEVNTEQAREWAQQALDGMVATGYIELRGEVQS
jgi:hypothetical protein